MTNTRLLSAITESRARFLGAINGVTETVARRRPADGEWSIIEVLAHMVAVDDCYLNQALDVVATPGIPFSYFEDEAWKRTHPSPEEFSLLPVLDQLEASHQRVLSIAGSLTDEDLAQPCRHPRGIVYTSFDIVLRLAAHDRNHEEQIAAIRAHLAV